MLDSHSHALARTSDALQLLRKARRVLKHTCILTFFLEQNKQSIDAFEQSRVLLEEEVNQLVTFLKGNTSWMGSMKAYWSIPGTWLDYLQVRCINLETALVQHLSGAPVSKQERGYWGCSIM
jgi:hypothetical protein